MQKRNTIILALLILLSIAGLSAYKIAYKRNLPATIHLRGDFTSSGGDRILAVDFDTEHAQIVRGTASYTYSERIENERRDVTRKCSFANSTWGDETGGACAITIYQLPTSLAAFETQKQDGTVKTAGDNCRHLNICYTIETK
jgi:hypothetical protein